MPESCSGVLKVILYLCQLLLLVLPSAQTARVLQSAPSTGYVLAWGNVELTGTPPTTTRRGVVKIAAGFRHALALTSKGEVIVWGGSESNLTSIPADAQTNGVDIAAGLSHSLALLRNGSVVAWGDNTYGQCDVPVELNDGSRKASAIAAGYSFSVAVANGSVKAWGNSDLFQPVPKEASTDIIAIAAGMRTVMAQKSDGTLLQWGADLVYMPAVQKGVRKGPATFSVGFDQVAAVTQDGSIAVWNASITPDYPTIIGQVSTPPLHNASGTYKAVSAGWNYTMALTTRGEVVTWGHDSGNGVMSVPAAAHSNVIAVAAGVGELAFALVAGSFEGVPQTDVAPVQTTAPVLEGHVYAYGIDSTGVVSGAPLQALSGGILKISAGRFHALALSAEGQVLAWGDDSFNQTSNVLDHTEEVGVLDLAAGGWHNILLLSNGTVHAWGRNDSGQCSVPDFDGLNVTAVSAGDFHSLALLSNGTVAAWGASTSEVDFKQTHVPEAALSDIVAIAAGGYTSMAVTSNGTLIQWGDVVDDPPDVLQEKGIRTTPGSIAAGDNHQLAVLKDGTIATWPVKHPAIPGILDQVLAAPSVQAMYVSVGHNLSAAVTETGEVVMWGVHSEALTPELLPQPPVLQMALGQEDVIALVADVPAPQGPAGLLMAGGSNVPEGKPDDGMPIVKVSAGAEHVMELTANGTVRVWGNPARQDLLDTSKVDGQVVVDVAAGQYHCLALLRNGTVVAWGRNDEDQANIPANVSGGSSSETTSLILTVYKRTSSAARATKIAAGYFHSLVVISNGTIVGWGANDWGDTYPPDKTHGITTDIAAGGGTSFAFINDTNSSNKGSCMAWGAVGVVPPAVLQEAVSVGGGLNHSVAILQNGSLVAWASSSYTNPGALNKLLSVPAGVTATAVDANSFHSVALLATGQLVTWGSANNSVLTVPSPFKVLGVAAGLNFTVAIVDADSVAMGHVNSAPGCNATSSQQGYNCNRAFTGVPGDWQLSYTVSVSPNPPQNPCTAGASPDATKPQLPEGATYWVHFMLSSTARGWIALSYPETLTSMYPAQAVLGYTNGNGASISSYHFEGYNLPAPDSTSWAGNVGAVTSTDGRSIICFSQAAVLLNNTHSRRLKQAGSNILTLNQDLHVQLASSPVPDITQKHTVVAAVTVGLTTGNQTVMNLTQMESSITNGSDVRSVPTPSSTTGLSTGAKAGIGIGCLAAALAVVGSLVYCWHRKQQHQCYGYKHQPSGTKKDFESNHGGPGQEGVAGLLQGDVFLAVAARKYGWTTSTALEGPLQAVEAGVNDIQLDALARDPAATSSPASGNASTVMQLSRKELRGNVQLLSDGLLGRGATALVFKCVWPSRFGPSSLLAIKVAKDGSTGDMRLLQSFTYEASVLSSAQHPNVVRLYGYCLEPPTLCLILELLPTSLKDVLYKGMPYPGASGSNQPSTSAGKTQVSAMHNRFHTQIREHASLEQPASTAPRSASNTVMAAADDSAVLLDVDPTQAPADGSVEVQVTGTGTGVLTVDEAASKDDQHSTDAAVCVHRPQLSCLQVVRLATDIAAGLAYLHGSNDMPAGGNEDDCAPAAGDGAAGSSSTWLRIVHRDLKPANILINSQGVAKISDFGLARQHEHSTVPTVHPGVGTLPYMAPELLLGEQAGMYGQAITNRVDIYSLAMIMWEMLSGCPPWKDMGGMAILAAVTQRQRPPLPGDMTFKDAAALQEVATQPASPAAIPQLNKLIRACWNQRDLRRPQAKEAYAQLKSLLAQMQKYTVATPAPASQ